MSRTFLVTGAASGIGADLARQLRARGERVCAADVRPITLEGADANLMCEKLDVREPAQWAALIEKIVARWGRLDVLMNVAGVIRVGWLHEQSADDVDFHFDINTKGVIFGMHAAVPTMRRQQQGHIINVASLAGITPVPGLSLYSASKFAVRGYSLAAALELRDSGIKVTAVCPDAVQTPMLDVQKDKPQAALTFSGPRPLTTDEVVRAILDRALVKAPIEIMLPTSRGWISKLASAFPSLAGLLMASLTEKGLREQKKLAQSSGS